MRSISPALAAGVAVISAVTVAIAPSVKAPVPAAPVTSAARVVFPAVDLAAAVQPRANPTGPQPTVAQAQIAQASLPNLLVDFVRRIVVPPSANAPFPTPQFPPVVGGTSVSSLIKNTYNAVEPWVQWGFELAAYAVGWVPYVGWLAPQIMIFYNLGERIVRSITFNIADWIGGQVSFAQGLINVGVDTINSFIFFANDQLAFWLPPLPPIPPIGPFAATETAELTESTESMATMSAEIPGEAAVTEDEPEQIETERSRESGDARGRSGHRRCHGSYRRGGGGGSPPHPHPAPSRLRARSAKPGSTPHPTRRSTTPWTAHRTRTRRT